jgi:hypothetical protein
MREPLCLRRGILTQPLQFLHPHPMAELLGPLGALVLLVITCTIEFLVGYGARYIRGVFLKRIAEGKGLKALPPSVSVRVRGMRKGHGW